MYVYIFELVIGQILLYDFQQYLEMLIYVILILHGTTPVYIQRVHKFLFMASRKCVDHIVILIGECQSGTLMCFLSTI